MLFTNVAYSRDADRIPITSDGFWLDNTKKLTGNNTTVAVPLFQIKGSIEVKALYGVVTTVLGSNNTAAYFRLNDQSNQSDVTLNTGTTISAAPVGSLLVKKGLAAAALTLLSASQERISEPTTLETPYFSPFVAVALPGAATNIEFVYTTTNQPTSGAIDFWLRFLPLSADASVVIL